MHHPVAQVMRDVPGSDDQNTLARKRCKGASQTQMVCRAKLRLQRKLHDRDIGTGIHPAQRYPRAVVQATTTIEASRDVRFLAGAFGMAEP